jgi:hypothetical protein
MPRAGAGRWAGARWGVGAGPRAGAGWGAVAGWAAAEWVRARQWSAAGWVEAVAGWAAAVAGARRLAGAGRWLGARQRVGAGRWLGARRWAGVAVALGLLAGATPAAGQARERHGADAVFAGPGVVIAWGVLRAAVEAETLVVIRIAVRGQAYAAVAVDAVDPFSGTRRPILPRRPVEGTLDVRSPRALVADFPRREVHLHRSAEAGPPALTVYYLGVPDTTPEFTSEADLLRYLADAVARAARPD